MNKTYTILSVLAVCAMLCIASCKQDVRSLDVSFIPVDTLLSPTDQSNLKLDPQSDSNIVFRWRPATTSDSGLLLYQVAFDSAGGNFKDPVYKVISDGKGRMNKASISQKELNKVASAAGIAASSTGKIEWMIITSKAAHAQRSAMSKAITIERPAGFATLPDSLYLFGSSTEAGEDLNNAIPLKKTSDGVFEIYTSLKTGSYQLIDKRSGSGTKYYVDTSDGMIKEGDESTKIKLSGTEAFRIEYDFTVAVSTKAEIKYIGLFQAAKNEEIGKVKYTGNSTWSIDSLPVDFVQFSWGKDDRYKFILHTSKGEEYWGSQNFDNSPPAGQSESYFYLFPVTNTQWDYTFKFDPKADGHEVNVDLYFQPQHPYTHEVTYLQ